MKNRQGNFKQLVPPAGLVEERDPVVLAVGHQDVPRAVHAQARRVVEAAGAGAGLAELLGYFQPPPGARPNPPGGAPGTPRPARTPCPGRGPSHRACPGSGPGTWPG